MLRLGRRRVSRLPSGLLTAMASALVAVAAAPLPAQSVVVESAGPKIDGPAPLRAVAPAQLAPRPLPALPLYGLPPETPSPRWHTFWDRNNRILFAGIAVMRALDYASTRNMQARGREEILLPDDVVNNSAGFAALEAAGAATSVGLAYLMHRTGHHKVERWISIVHIGVAGFGDARNYALKSKHPAPAP